MPPYEPKVESDWLVHVMEKLIRRNRPNPDTPFKPFNKPRNARHGRPRGR